MTEFREEWLHNAVTELRSLFAEIDIDVPTVRVAAGWPSARGTSLKKRVLGECWKPVASADGVSQIFMNPMEDDVVKILGVLAHELIHAWDKGENGHKGPFVRAAREVGLTGPWTATSVGDELRPRLEQIAETLGEYPHSKLTPTLSGKKPQSTRMLKVQCPVCDYTVRTTQKWIDAGLPSCPDGDEMEVEIK